MNGIEDNDTRNGQVETIIPKKTGKGQVNNSPLQIGNIGMREAYNKEADRGQSQTENINGVGVDGGNEMEDVVMETQWVGGGNVTENSSAEIQMSGENSLIRRVRTSTMQLLNQRKTARRQWVQVRYRCYRQR